MPRTIVWFSCGAASAVAAKLVLEERDAEIVYCNTKYSEHPDNARFLDDVEHWIGKRVKLIGSVKYRTVDEVYEDTRYMAGIKGARCTAELKKVPRFDFQLPDDIHVFGYTAEEHSRIKDFCFYNPELSTWFVLHSKSVLKRDCYEMLENAGIKLPMMYKLGFKNNNCIACVKATSPVYWNLTRRHFPETFDRRSAQSRELGVRLVRIDGERRFLDELPMQHVITSDENISCGPECRGNVFH